MNTPIMYEAIEKNYREDYKNLLRIASNKLGNLWAEDCVQDTYEAVLKAAHRLHNNYDIKYLMRAALFNRIKDYLYDEIDSEEIDEKHIYGGEIEEKWKDVGVAKRAIELIDSRKEPLRTGLYLNLLEGVSGREVSRIVGIPQQVVSYHARQIREELEDD